MRSLGHSCPSSSIASMFCWCSATSSSVDSMYSLCSALCKCVFVCVGARHTGHTHTHREQERNNSSSSWWRIARVALCMPIQAASQAQASHTHPKYHILCYPPHAAVCCCLCSSATHVPARNSWGVVWCSVCVVKRCGCGCCFVDGLENV